MIQTLYLTLQGGLSEGEATAVQGDKNLSVLRCVLRGYRREEGDRAQLRTTKPDGTPCFLLGIPDSDNAFRFLLTEEMTAVEGDAHCDVVLFRNGGAISSDEFSVKIRPPAAEPPFNIKEGSEA